MEYLGFDMGYGWWRPAASKMQLLHDMQIRDDPKKGLHDVKSLVGACNFYGRHIHNFTYSSAPLTDLISKTTPLRWTAREEECFQELKKKIASSNCVGVPRPKGKIVLITDDSSYPRYKKMNCLTIYRAITSIHLQVRALRCSPKRLSSVWMSNVTCPCALLESWRVGV